MSPYQLELSGQNFRRAEPQLSQLVQWLNNQPNYRYDIASTSNHGVVLSNDPGLPLLGDALSRGSLGIDAEARRSAWVFSFQHGITPRWSAGMAIPIFRQSVRFRPEIGGRNTALDIYEGFAAGNSGGVQNLVDGLQLLGTINTETFQQILEARGYERFGDYEGSGVGDLILGSRYLYSDRATRLGPLLGSIQAQITVPTGRLASAARLTEMDFGTGAWTGQLIHITNAVVHDRVTLSHQLAYTLKLPFSRVRRVPRQPGDFLPDASTEEPVRSRLGDQWMTSAGALVRLNPTLTMETQVFWEWKALDRFSGSLQPAASYESLGYGTASRSCYAQVSLVASSVSAFLRDHFAVPGDATLTWSQPISGRNQIHTPYGMAELALYF
jgi:hypothetical protein